MSTSDIVSISYPCFVLTIPPYSVTDDNRQIVDESEFLIIDSRDGTPFLVLFRDKNTMNIFISETRWNDQSMPLVVDSERNLFGLVRMLSARLEKPLGILVDPDPRLQGFPIGPNEVAR